MNDIMMNNSMKSSINDSTGIDGGGAYSGVTGCVSNIQRTSVSDGPGVRTTVFLAGCPLNCRWCHNPETRGINADFAGGADAAANATADTVADTAADSSADAAAAVGARPRVRSGIGVLMFYENRCTGCGACVLACPTGAQTLVEAVAAGELDSEDAGNDNMKYETEDADGSSNSSIKNYRSNSRHRRRGLNRTRCTACGACTLVCPSGALELRGRLMAIDGVMTVVKRDAAFYAATGGGLTISGGEPLYQFDFTRAMLRAARAAGIHTCLDTSGWGGRAHELVGLVDLFLWDVKETDAARHLEWTGAEMAPALDSLMAVDAAGGAVRLRCPLIPGVNARPGHMRAVGALANTLRGAVGIDLIAYHELGVGKQSAMGETPERFERIPDADRAALLAALTETTPVPARWHV